MYIGTWGKYFKCIHVLIFLQETAHLNICYFLKKIRKNMIFF